MESKPTVPVDPRRLRIFLRALALVRDYHGVTAWTRGDGTSRTTYRRYQRGLVIVWDRDTRRTPAETSQDSVLRVELRDAGTVFEARFDGGRADDRAVPTEIVRDDAGDWEALLFRD